MSSKLESLGPSTMLQFSPETYASYASFQHYDYPYSQICPVSLDYDYVNDLKPNIQHLRICDGFALSDFNFDNQLDVVPVHVIDDGKGIHFKTSFHTVNEAGKHNFAPCFSELHRECVALYDTSEHHNFNDVFMSFYALSTQPTGHPSKDVFEFLPGKDCCYTIEDECLVSLSSPLQLVGLHWHRFRELRFRELFAAVNRFANANSVPYGFSGVAIRVQSTAAIYYVASQVLLGHSHDTVYGEWILNVAYTGFMFMNHQVSKQVNRMFSVMGMEFRMNLELPPLFLDGNLTATVISSEKILPPFDATPDEVEFINDIQFTLLGHRLLKYHDTKNNLLFKNFTCMISSDVFVTVGVFFTTSDDEFEIYISSPTNSRVPCEFKYYSVSYKHIDSIMQFINMFKFSWLGRLCLSLRYSFDHYVDVGRSRMNYLLSRRRTTVHAAYTFKLTHGTLYAVCVSNPGRGRYLFTTYFRKFAAGGTTCDPILAAVYHYLYDNARLCHGRFNVLVEEMHARWRQGFLLNSTEGVSSPQNTFHFYQFHQHDTLFGGYCKRRKQTAVSTKIFTIEAPRRVEYYPVLYVQLQDKFKELPIVSNLLRYVRKIEDNSGSSDYSGRFMLELFAHVTMNHTLSLRDQFAVYITLIEGMWTFGDGLSQDNYCWLDGVDGFEDSDYYDNLIQKLNLSIEVYKNKQFYGFSHNYDLLDVQGKIKTEDE